MLFQGIGIKLALGIGLLVSVCFLGLYMQHLRDNIKIQQLEIAAFTKERDELKANAIEIERRQGVVKTVTVAADEVRKENRRIRDQRNQDIDTAIKDGKDKPVGDLLNDFFNRSN